MPIGDSDRTHGAQQGLLSRRELQILEMTTLGLTNTQIATRLNISTHAIKFHLASVYRKLDVANRTEAAVTFMRWREQRLATNRDRVD